MAGQQTTSTVFSFLIYELAVNSEVQVKLAEEVLAVMAISNGKLTYKTLLEMEYLDMVISGKTTWPVAVSLTSAFLIFNNSCL